MPPRLEFVQFLSRDDRARYIVSRFGPQLQGRVLDVGCDEARVKNLRPDLDYVGIDIGGKPDLVLNLDEVVRLPFDDGQFDCVLCSDVLEHLNNIHSMFGELVRLTRRHVLLSLPNCWCCARQPIERGHGAISHYGLPPEPKLDRHKWFFAATEALAFVEALAAKHSVRITETVLNEKPRFLATRWIRRLRYPRFWDYHNRYSHTLWWVLAKSN
jgi:SAM-dependent methyltransferase